VVIADLPQRPESGAETAERVAASSHGKHQYHRSDFEDTAVIVNTSSVNNTRMCQSGARAAKRVAGSSHSKHQHHRGGSMDTVVTVDTESILVSAVAAVSMLPPRWCWCLL